MPGEFEESGVLFAHIVEDADGAGLFAGQSDDLAPGAAELPLQRLHLRDRRVEMLLEEMVENVHEVRRGLRLGIHHQDNTEEQRQS